ncbi:iron ABC transporter permease [Corynebacterium lizhenjunii]|uniref:Iron ABC transporter permease n=1 Tax=Corynebacterium lizhenjunii TaxID=2709394 RepID=A0A7T0KDF4_9CORY|nr:iron ABC transporter permease [Corynebacterium lizhenjunii]QPK78741.1 iron ABC transporter permease [Corynebacterium lizhenjunii]
MSAKHPTVSAYTADAHTADTHTADAPASSGSAGFGPAGTGGIGKHRSIKAAVLAGLALALVAATLASVMFGVRDITVADAWAALGGATDTASQAAAYLRVPRTVLAIAVGAALALSGTTFQAITRNPLADPGIFGVLSGASLAVVVGIAFFSVSRPVPMMLIAITGAFAAAAFVYFIGTLGTGKATPLALALAGAATAAACSSLVSAILLPRTDVMDQFRFWQIGSVGGAKWDLLGLAAPLFVLGVAIIVLSAGGLNALALGDDTATGLGIHVTRTRLVATCGAVILCGTATAIAGPIGFVGLIVPHVLRLVLGTDHRVLLPATALGGAVLLVAADTLGRVVAPPTEVAVGIITPLIGAPLFIWIVRRSKVREL